MPSVNSRVFTSHVSSREQSTLHLIQDGVRVQMEHQAIMETIMANSCLCSCLIQTMLSLGKGAGALEDVPKSEVPETR
jgi:sulfur transfer complex TusBCD TusB component (DsrH family)